VALKRSNRLILLVGIVLAAVAFVAIIALFNSGTTNPGPEKAPTELPTVVATVDVALGTQIRADMIATKQIKTEDRASDAIGDPSQIVGQIVRTNVVNGAQMTQTMFTTTGVGLAPGPLLPKGLRAQSVRVDQISGVGTLINVGDRVDAVVGFGGGGGGDGGGTQCGTPFPVVTVDKQTGAIVSQPGFSGISTKLLLQNMQVVGVELPPVEQTSNGTASPAPGSEGTAFNGQQEIVILAVTPQQSEVVKYAQVDGCISLILRSPKDYVDDLGQTIEPTLDLTTGIILKTLVDNYGVLPPQVVEAILPKK
jgi:Flp pilus assembly protein CpaB